MQQDSRPLASSRRWLFARASTTSLSRRRTSDSSSRWIAARCRCLPRCLCFALRLWMTSSTSVSGEGRRENRDGGSCCHDDRPVWQPVVLLLRCLPRLAPSSPVVAHYHLSLSSPLLSGTALSSSYTWRSQPPGSCLLSVSPCSVSGTRRTCWTSVITWSLRRSIRKQQKYWDFLLIIAGMLVRCMVYELCMYSIILCL